MNSSAGQPLRLQRRVDLETQRQTFQGRDYWVVKDPLTLKYYRFEEEEYALLQLIDGQHSTDQIKRKFDYRFAPQKITLQELYQFTGMLYRSSLLISDSPGQGAQLKRRGEQTRQREWRQSLSNILAIRYRGFDPDSLLATMDRWLGWFFSWPAFILVLLLWIGAGGLIASQFETFQAKLPSFYEFFAAKNWVWLALVMAGTKVLHEFGHGLACKRFGGQCHEMGVMLLVLTPCLYVNVSDSWLLPSKWKRALIAAAGMYVELVLAAVAVFMWWFSQPGLVNQLSLNVIFVSSVSTLLFNANPLLRYDGYYILSDLLEIPNLRSKATSILQRFCGAWLLGIESGPDPFLPQRRKWMFATYSIAAALYRWVITFSIFWFVYRVLEPYGLKIIGQLIALTAIYGLVGMPLIQLYRFFSVPGRLNMVKFHRAALSAVIAGALVIAILLVPIPYYVHSPFYVQPANAKNVYVDVPGNLAEIYVGQQGQIRAGEPIIRLHSQELRVQLASLKTEVETAAVRLNNLRIQSSGSPKTAEGIRAAEIAYEASLANFEQRSSDMRRLIVTAPLSGFLVTPPRIEPSDRDPITLENWTGSPLEANNLGAYLQESTLVAQVAPELSQLEAVLAVDQQDVEMIRTRQPVELLVTQLPGQKFESEIQQLTPTEMKRVPKNLSSQYGGPIVTRDRGDGEQRPDSTKYLIKVPFEHAQCFVSPGSTGTAKVRIGSRTIGQRIWRLAAQTFQFEL